MNRALARWSLLAALSMAGAGCPAGSPADCAVVCGAGGACPDGLDCVEGRCRSAGAIGTCTAGGDDDGGTDDPDADAAAPTADADPQVACARTCYEENAFCVQDDACVSPDQSCALAMETDFPMDEDGPLVHSAVQVDADLDEASLCLVNECPGGDSLCAIRFGWFDPQPDVEGPALQSRVYFLEPGGDVNPTADVPTLDGDEIVVRGCFPIGAFEGAIQMQDSASNMSNPVCFSGVADGP
jgi:hypothetical protein